MNQQQKAVTKLLLATLKIIEEDNPGEIINYFARNLVAKYSLANDYYLISQKTNKLLSSKGIQFHKRGKKCTENGYTFEHAIPAKVVLEMLLKTESDNERKKILEFSNKVVILSNKENELLKQNKLNSKMPKDWKFFDNVFARYDSVGIKILDEKIQMTGAVKR